MTTPASGRGSSASAPGRALRRDDVVMGSEVVATPTVEGAARRPAPVLTPFIERYHGYRMDGFEPGVHRGAPAPHMTFIVAVGPAIDVVRQTDARQAPRRYRAVLGGLQTTSALIAHDGFQEGVSIQLSPLGCRALFGLPARALWDTAVELDEVVGSVGAELAGRIQETGSWRVRFDACDEVLTRLLDGRRGSSPASRPVDPVLAAAWGVLVGSGGLAPVASVADQVGWSRQHLRKRFVDELGLSPKAVGRVVRLERARRLLLAPTPAGALDAPGATPQPGIGLADVAARCGYADQSHLTREFVDMLGCTPGRLVAEELPSVQDGKAEQSR